MVVVGLLPGREYSISHLRGLDMLIHDKRSNYSCGQGIGFWKGISS